MGSRYTGEALVFSDTFITKLPELPIEDESQQGFIIHTVKPLENLHSIARHYFEDEKEFYRIVNANQENLTDYFNLVVDMKIKIPLKES